MFENMVNISRKDFDKIMTSCSKKTFKPSKRDENTKAYFDSRYLNLLEQLLDDIRIIADYEKYPSENNDMSEIKDIVINMNLICNELDEIYKNPPEITKPLKISIYKRYLFNIKRTLKEIKKKGGCPWYINDYMNKYKMYYKAFKKPVTA
jgi:hypothetical protein